MVMSADSTFYESNHIVIKLKYFYRICLCFLLHVARFIQRQQAATDISWEIGEYIVCLFIMVQF